MVPRESMYPYFPPCSTGYNEDEFSWAAATNATTAKKTPQIVAFFTTNTLRPECYRVPSLTCQDTQRRSSDGGFLAHSPQLRPCQAVACSYACATRNTKSSRQCG